MRPLRPVRASLLTPLVMLLPILLLSSQELFASAGIGPVDVDDAPQRAFALLLISLPLLYVGLSLGIFLAGTSLLRLGLTSLRHFVLGASAMTLLLALPLGLAINGHTQTDGADGLITVMVLVSFCSTMTIPGALCWWCVATSQLPWQRRRQPDIDRH